MIVDVIEVSDKYLTVEYVDRTGMPQRKLIAKGYFPSRSTKGKMEMREYRVRQAINYSDVDLQLTLGAYVGWLPTDEITKGLRAASLWTRKDIEAHPNDVILVVKRLARGDTSIKPNDVLQAALRIPDAKEIGS